MSTARHSRLDVSATGIARRAATDRQTRPRVPADARVSLRIRENMAGVVELVRRDNGQVFFPCSSRVVAKQIQEVFSK